MIKNICQLTSVGVKNRTKETNKKISCSCADPVKRDESISSVH